MRLWSLGNHPLPYAQLVLRKEGETLLGGLSISEGEVTWAARGSISKKWERSVGFFLTNFFLSDIKCIYIGYGRDPVDGCLLGRGAEGETPIIRWGKLSGKRTVINCIPWREPFVRPPKGKTQSLRAKGNLSGKGTGEPPNDF